MCMLAPNGSDLANNCLVQIFTVSTYVPYEAGSVSVLYLYKEFNIAYNAKQHMEYGRAQALN